jgi:hypothetical protein
VKDLRSITDPAAGWRSGEHGDLGSPVRCPG